MKLDTVMARCARGLEWVAYDEISSEGFQIRTNSTDRTLFVDLGMHPATSATRWRTVEDAFLLIYRAEDFGRERIAFKSAVDSWELFNWPAAIAGAAQNLGVVPLRFKVSASFTGKRNFSRFEVEDALGDLIERKCSMVYISNRESTDSVPTPSLRIHLDGIACSIGMRIGLVPLHRRNWKLCTTAGTLNAPVAAAITYFLARDRALRVLDPFCGCGTILIELALRNVTRHDLLGFDLSGEAVVCAKRNAAEAGVELRLEIGDAGKLPISDCSIDALVSNPPWGKQVEVKRPQSLLENFVREAARVLTDDGCLIVIHDWGSAFGERLRYNNFDLLHEQNLRTAGNIARITVAHRRGFSDGSRSLDITRLMTARNRLMSVSGERFLV